MWRPYISRRGYGQITALFIALWLLSSLPAVQAQDSSEPEVECPLRSDTNYQYKFLLGDWVNRGACIRRGNETACYNELERVLSSLVKLREAEYASAASVLSLLPTIGALFGPPTNEIWRLKSIVPLGGALAMGISFGGALMPVHLKDYEKAVSKENTAIGSIVSLHKNPPGSQRVPTGLDERLRDLGKKIRERIDRPESVRLPKRTLLFGLFGMFVLFALAQSAIAVVEQGGLVNFSCSARYWMHIWYFLGMCCVWMINIQQKKLTHQVTFTTFLEDRAHRPFKKTYKLYVSSLPYEVEILGGQPITDYFSNSAASENALKQMKTLTPASMNFYGSSLSTRARNSVMVTVSIVGQQRWEPIWQRLSKGLSVAVFVTGTAYFASVVLLSLIMSVVVLTLTLAAGIFGRAIASWIVSHVARTEPMIHIISRTKEEAYQAIAEIISLKSNDGSPFQVEINGHILINERRVATRSWLKVAIFGVLAEPYDIARPFRKRTLSTATGMSLSPLSPQLTSNSRGGSSIPFLSGPSLGPNGADHDPSKSGSQHSVRSVPSNDHTNGWNAQILRKPVPIQDLER